MSLKFSIELGLCRNYYPRLVSGCLVELKLRLILTIFIVLSSCFVRYYILLGFLSKEKKSAISIKYNFHQEIYNMDKCCLDKCCSDSCHT